MESGLGGIKVPSVARVFRTSVLMASVRFLCSYVVCSESLFHTLIPVCNPRMDIYISLVLCDVHIWRMIYTYAMDAIMCTRTWPVLV